MSVYAPGLLLAENPPGLVTPLLIRGATIVGMADASDDLEQGDILIRDGRIANMEASIAPDGAFVIEAAGMIAIPGFQDTHRHSWEGQLRRIMPSGDLETYRCTTHRGFAEHYRPEDIYAGTILTALHGLSSGITTILDYSHNSQSIDHCNAAIDALADSGIRAVYACSAPSILGHAKTSCIWPGVIADLAQSRFTDPEGRLSIRVAGTPSTLTQEFFDLADQLQIGVSVDAVSGDSSSGWILSAERNGWLGPNRTLIHCAGLSDSAWAAIARTHTTVSLCPHADMQYMIGEPPLHQALAAGIRPSISVDDDVGLSSDMWTQMRLLSASHRRRAMLGPLELRKQAATLTAFDLLDFATAQGAKANGLDHRCGRLMVGMDADVVLIAGHDINTMPLNNVYGTVVQAADSSSVDTVIVAGVIRKYRGQLTCVDIDVLRSLVRDSRDRLSSRLGRKIGILDRLA